MFQAADSVSLDIVAVLENWVKWSLSPLTLSLIYVCTEGGLLTLVHPLHSTFEAFILLIVVMLSLLAPSLYFVFDPPELKRKVKLKLCPELFHCIMKINLELLASFGLTLAGAEGEHGWLALAC